MPPSVLPSHDSPPSYLDINMEALTISPGSIPNRARTIPNIKPSNFVTVGRANDCIKGSWLIDPSLFIPSSFLPPLQPGGARRNLFLESKNGAIDADVYLLPTSYSDQNTSKYILIHTQSNNGSVRTRLHEVNSSTGEVRLPIRLSTLSDNGSINVQIPRSFSGPIRIRTHHGSIQFSAAVHVHLTQFSEMDGVQRSFLGNFNPSQWEIGVPWEGDELLIETKNGSVKVFFDDEGDGPTTLRGQSFFSRFFPL